MTKLKTYSGKCCPNCKEDNYFKIYSGTDGLFSRKEFSHYKCNKCNHEFESVEYISLVQHDDLRKLTDIIQNGLQRKIGAKEVVAQAKAMGVAVFYNPLFKINKRVKEIKNMKK